MANGVKTKAQTRPIENLALNGPEPIDEEIAALVEEFGLQRQYTNLKTVFSTKDGLANALAALAGVRRGR